jgi:hypothetical protein
MVKIQTRPHLNTNLEHYHCSNSLSHAILYLHLTVVLPMLFICNSYYLCSSI